MTDIIDIDKLKEILEDFAEIRDWKKFHNPKSLSMALACEAGELLEISQWMSELDSMSACNTPSIKEKTAEELADVLLYLIQIAAVLDINLTNAIKNKLIINNIKYPVDLVQCNKA